MAASKRNTRRAWEATLRWEHCSVPASPASRSRRTPCALDLRFVPRNAAQPHVKSDADGAEQEEGAGPEQSLTEDTDEVAFLRVWVCFVEFSRAGGDRLRFRVNPTREGRLTFSDPRDREAGTAGTTGIWGTRPALRAARPRSLTPTAFKVEAARFVGAERAEQIVREIMS
jgi:hypothetical protein